MLKYIFSQIASSLSYILCIYFINKELIHANTMLIMLHVDLLIPIFFLLYYKFFISKNEQSKSKILSIFNTTKKRMQFLLFIPAIGVSLFKAFLFDKMGVINSSISDLVVPIFVSIGCIFLFKEKLTKTHYKIIGFSVIGFIISVYSNMSVQDIKLLVFYIIFKSISDLIVRSYCKGRDSDLQAVLAENAIFAIFGSLILIAFYKIDISLLLNPCLWLIACICHIQHVLQAKGIRNAKTLAMLEYSKFLKVGVYCLLSYFILHEKISIQNAIGFLIIVSVFLKYRKYLK